jgi:streptogramin lyase
MNRSVPFPSILSIAFAGLICSASADAAKITEYPIPTAAAWPSSIQSGPDGRLWFGELAKSTLGSITTDGAITEYHLTNDSGGIAVVPGRILAFAETTGLGFSTVDGQVTEFPGFSVPQNVVFGPDGRIWITQLNSASLVAFHYLANSPSTATFALSSPASDVTVGPDGRIWATENSAKKVAVCPPEGGTCTEYPLPASPWHVAAGPDGNVWFTEGIANKIARMTPTGSLTEFPLPTAGAGPAGICAGRDGNLWFTEYDANKIGRITTSGVVTEYALATPGSYPYAITWGPDGNVWFTERANVANKIGKLQVFIPGDVNDDGDTNVTDVFYLINYLFAGGPAPK